MDGILVIDKPAGPTSHDVVSKVRRALRVKKVGHTGTLDPAATGVLPLVLGQATKLSRYLTASRKSYDAVIRLGETTDTLDAAGEITATQEVGPLKEADIQRVLDGFLGEQEQVPPMYSAKKVDGKKLYQLARKGIEVEREAKAVTIHQLDMGAVELPDFHIQVTCSAGTYVRVLAQDIGERLGCGGHLKSLRRTGAGVFHIGQAVTLDALLENPELAKEHLLPVDQALGSLTRINIAPEVARLLCTGYQLNVGDLRSIDVPAFAKEDPLAIGVAGSNLVAIARAEIASDALDTHRRNERALKTERVLRRNG